MEMQALIDREKLVSSIANDVPLKYFMGRSLDKAVNNLNYVLEFVGKQDTVQTEKPLEAEWTRGADMEPKDGEALCRTIIYCSNCRSQAYWDSEYGQQLFAHCPRCGAKMKVKK